MRGLAGASVVALLATACATPGAPSRAIPAVTDDRAPRAAAVTEEQAIAAATQLHDDPLVTEYVAGIADRLLLADERSRGVTVAVVRDPTIDAFALADGPIYLHTGLLSRLENEAQLAAVIARTLAHRARGNALGRAGDAEITAAIAKIAPSITASLTPAVGEDGAARLSPMASVILGKRLGAAYTAAMTGYGREAEAQADADAVARLTQAGYDVGQATGAFERLRREAKAGGALEMFFLGNDVVLAERIDSMRRLAAASGVRGGGANDEYGTRMESVVRENASLEIRAGRFRAGQEQLDRALAIRPGDALAYLYQGDLHRLRSQRARSVADRDELARAAMTSYLQCAAADPSLSVVYRQMGLLYFQQRQFMAAREAFARYVAATPGAPDGARASEYLAP